MATRKRTNNDLQTIQCHYLFFFSWPLYCLLIIICSFFHVHCIVCRSLFVLFLMAIVLFVDHYLFFFSWPLYCLQIIICSFSHGHCIVCRSLFVLFLMAIVWFVDHYLFFFLWPLYCL
jgi:hypothetical protein